ncbi:MAG: hypothetical protein COC19_08590 [SAR86 cluster bacterium]|uniref:FAD assembly factor SdhE n=1 Tax=SAR86 cluster bacterium TaxID=2030880 RepID=A0A2A4MEL4_9GAMM|nr:MAG: hypothetical protein COC19_08590 [SAR86 cluster bacterium]
MQSIDKRKIFWHSRRGMLELDLLLVPYATNEFEKLSYTEQLLYQEFLEEEDQDIFAYLLKRQLPEDTRFLAVIEQILAQDCLRG